MSSQRNVSATRTIIPRMKRSKMTKAEALTVLAETLERYRNPEAARPKRTGDDSGKLLFMPSPYSTLTAIEVLERLQLCLLRRVEALREAKPEGFALAVTELETELNLLIPAVRGLQK
jgi:hypothetical protein